MVIGVQQIMLGTVTGSEAQALETLKAIKNAGYDGIELNGFMIKPTSFLVRALTKAAGMPTGKGGSYDWKKLVEEAGLMVTSIHEDLGSIEKDTDAIIEEARNFGTDKVVITGMYRFDYSDESEVKKLAHRMNVAGERLSKGGVRLLYHNHNIEFAKLKGKGSLDEKIEADCPSSVEEKKAILDYMDQNAYGLIIKETDPEFLNFEMDSYWIADAGVDPLDVMNRLGGRLKLYHINDRGNRNSSSSMTPIIKQDSMELGCGNMNLPGLIAKAKELEVEAIILESHKNWIDKSPIKSLEVSGRYLKKYKVNTCK